MKWMFIGCKNVTVTWTLDLNTEHGENATCNVMRCDLWVGTVFDFDIQFEVMGWKKCICICMLYGLTVGAECFCR
jgi:hypothetical protein